MSLLDKAEENLKAATWAESEKMYNVAVSRLYYSMFQRLIHCLNVLEIQYNESGKNSHNEAIEALKRHLNLFRRNELTSVQTHFNKLKEKRILADYKERNVCFSEKDPNKENKTYIKIKNSFDFLVERFDNYIEGV